MPYKNRARLPIFFDRPQFPVEKSVFRLANGTSKVQSMVIRNTYEGKTDQLPEDWHRKLVVALAHDTVNVEGERLLSDVVLEGDYEIGWQDFLQYPLAQAGFKVQVTPFNATNSNCQTCEEMSQLSLVDDTTDEIWDEGTTHDFPDILTANDTICCSPFVISLFYWNAVYFDAVSISADGILTATVKNPSPDYNNILIATYQVTCADGSYDRADVYGNISGSTVSFCTPALSPEFIQTSATTGTVSWGVPVPVPSGNWIWTLYETSDLGTPIQSGTCLPHAGTVNLTGLTASVSYTIVIVADCGSGSYSTPVSLVFEITGLVGFTCGDFEITYLPAESDPPQQITYIDCNGDIQNETFTYGQVVSRCMQIVAGEETPLYFVASSGDITINYSGLC